MMTIMMVLTEDMYTIRLQGFKFNREKWNEVWRLCGDIYD